MNPKKTLVALVLAHASLAACAFGQQVIIEGSYIEPQSGVFIEDSVSLFQSSGSGDWSYDGYVGGGLGALRCSARVAGTLLNVTEDFGLLPFGGYIARFDDLITINTSNPLLEGQTGLVRFSARVSGTLSASSTAAFEQGGLTSAYSAEFRLQTIPGVRNSVTVGRGAAVSNASLSVDETIFGEYSFIFGIPFGIDLIGDVYVSRAISDSIISTVVSASADISVEWQGVTFVADNTGAPLPPAEWSLESASGTDYTRAISFPETTIPEPTCLVLLPTIAAGLLRPSRWR